MRYGVAQVEHLPPASHLWVYEALENIYTPALNLHKPFNSLSNNWIFLIYKTHVQNTLIQASLLPKYLRKMLSGYSVIQGSLHQKGVKTKLA